MRVDDSVSEQTQIHIMKTTQNQMRADWIREHSISDEDELYRLSQYHPDEICLVCPKELIKDNEYYIRYGYGYVLGDGAWYNPVNQEFFYVKTVED